MTCCYGIPSRNVFAVALARTTLHSMVDLLARKDRREVFEKWNMYPVIR